MNRARGEAEAIATLSEATARSIEKISQALNQEGGDKAAALQIAEKYIEAFSKLAKEGNTIVLPSNVQHPATMVAQALSIYESIQKKPRASSPYFPNSLESSTNKE